MAKQQQYYHNKMPVTPTNCYLCRNTWLGKGPICDICSGKITPSSKPVCTFCGSFTHTITGCLDAQLKSQQLRAAAVAATQKIYAKWSAKSKPMPHRHTPKHRGPRRGTNPYTNYPPLMKSCPNCKGNYLIESKAGNVCSSCKTVVHNPCRECDSSNTHGVKGDGVQFIECNDCLFIE